MLPHPRVDKGVVSRNAPWGFRRARTLVSEVHHNGRGAWGRRHPHDVVIVAVVLLLLLLLPLQGREEDVHVVVEVEAAFFVDVDLPHPHPGGVVVEGRLRVDSPHEKAVVDVDRRVDVAVPLLARRGGVDPDVPGLRPFRHPPPPLGLCQFQVVLPVDVS